MFGMILILEKGSGGSLQVYLVLSLERWMERRGAGSWGWVERDNWLNTEDGRLGGYSDILLKHGLYHYSHHVC